MNILEKYFNSIQHFRMAKPYLKDIETLNMVAYYFDYNNAVRVLSKLTLKYMKTINQIGKLLTGVIAFKDMRLYKQKNEEDIIYDIYYLIRCIVVECVVTCGLEPNINTVINKLKQEGFDFEDIEIS